MSINGALKISSINDEINIEKSIKKIIVFEPFVDCNYYYKNSLSKFIKSIKPSILLNLELHFVSIVITDEAQTDLNRLISEQFSYPIFIHYHRIVSRNEISPYYSLGESINDPTFKILSKFDKNIDNNNSIIKIANYIPFQVNSIFWSENLTKSCLFKINTKLVGDEFSLRQNISDKLKLLRYNSESNTLEFKASLKANSANWKQIKKLANSWRVEEDLNQKSSILAEIEKNYYKKNPTSNKDPMQAIIMHSIAKTIAGFGNSNGGKLIVGIDDDLTIVGLKPDLLLLGDYEGIRRCLDEIVENYLGKIVSELIEIDFENIYNDIEVLHINVKKSKTEIFVNIDAKGTRIVENPEFYIRRMQETKSLTVAEFRDYIKNREN